MCTNESHLGVTRCTGPQQTASTLAQNVEYSLSFPMRMLARVVPPSLSCKLTGRFRCGQIIQTRTSLWNLSVWSSHALCTMQSQWQPQAQRRCLLQILSSVHATHPRHCNHASRPAILASNTNLKEERGNWKCRQTETPAYTQQAHK